MRALNIKAHASNVRVIEHQDSRETRSYGCKVVKYSENSKIEVLKKTILSAKENAGIGRVVYLDVNTSRKVPIDQNLEHLAAVTEVLKDQEIELVIPLPFASIEGSSGEFGQSHLCQLVQAIE